MKTWVFALGVASAACVEQDARQTFEGNDQLGIAELRLSETATTTVLDGLDPQGNLLARLELEHGVFALSGSFRDDYETPEVDGRRLDIFVAGERLHWETAGYEPVRELPAPPATQWAIRTMLADPVVKRTLDRWQIGFEPFAGGALDAEAAYVSGSYRGTDPLTCDNAATCGTAYYGTVNTCGGGAAALQAARATQTAGTNCGLYTSSYDQVLVSQCCPAGSGGQSNTWYAQKACPTTSSNSTQCGTRTSGACKGCPSYPTDASSGCSTSVGASVGTCGTAVYSVGYSYLRCISACPQVSCDPVPDGCGGTCPIVCEPP